MKITSNQLRGYVTAKREWISDNDAYNKQKFGITKSQYYAIHHAITDLTGIVGGMPSLAAINRRLENRNPGTSWHVDRENELRVARKKYFDKPGSEQWNRLNERILEERVAADASRRLGMNPKKGQKKCPICGKLSDYQWQAGGWYCPKHKFFFPSDLRNPGAAWHQARSEDSKRMRDEYKKYSPQWFHHAERSNEQRLMSGASRLAGIPNPIKKKFPILPIIVIGVLAWIIYKNRQ